jgi:hypothetical protein
LNLGQDISYPEIFLSPSKENSRIISRLDQYLLLPHPFQFTIHLSPHLTLDILDTNIAVKEPIIIIVIVPFSARIHFVSSTSVVLEAVALTKPASYPKYRYPTLAMHACQCLSKFCLNL